MKPFNQIHELIRQQNPRTTGGFLFL